MYKRQPCRSCLNSMDMRSCLLRKMCIRDRLNTNYYSIQFLKENDCDKYYRYNKRLLFDEQRQEILEELDEVEQDLNTALK